MRALDDLNREFREQYQVNSAIAARTKAYELAARMQLSAPDAVDFSAERESVKRLYGIGEKETDDFGKRLLLARRLVERGVRFVQICHAGGGIHGSTDEFGYRAVENPQYISDLQATILHLIGLDHKKMEVEINGRPVRLVEAGSEPIWGILA